MAALGLDVGTADARRQHFLLQEGAAGFALRTPNPQRISCSFKPEPRHEEHTRGDLHFSKRRKGLIASVIGIGMPRNTSRVWTPSRNAKVKDPED